MPAHPTFAGGAAVVVGQFRYLLASQLWEWSGEAAHIHGHPSIAMTRSSEQVMSHQHPDDHAKQAVTLEHVRYSQGSFDSRHRIIDALGNTRDVVVVGQQLRGPTGEVVGTTGFYLDVTPGSLKHDERQRERQVGQRVAEIAERRTVIDEVKGMLMLVYRIDDAHAFELLRWRSQLTNTKLRAFSEQLRIEFSQLDYDETLPPRSVFDQLLLTAHERITPETAA